MKALIALLFVALTSHLASAKELHVSVKGNDPDKGSRSKPFKTISAAARVAQPGDVITVHAGVYRERVAPPRGGVSDKKRIVYRAAPGERVEIKGSEAVRNWVRVQDDVWQVILPNSLFGSFNPYSDLIRGDWFNPKGREHHTGAVYLNGDWLDEAARLDDLLKPVGNLPLWFGQVDKDNTTIWAQFKGMDPNAQLVEINVRRTVFYPEQPGMNYVTVRGFVLRHAATPWAPPTAEQVGLVGTHWSKGWIIEDNEISHSRCSGVTLGKYGDQWDNTSANSAEGYVKTIERALTNGWNEATIGHHIVRSNIIHDCEQTGICGSLGAVFSQITDNHIYHIHVRRLFGGAEMSAIKIHAAIDVLIKHNRVHHCIRAFWLDWMAQGTHITGNLCYANLSDDLFVEVDHGPFLADNNLLLSPVSLLDVSEGGAYAHNLMTGQIVTHSEHNRDTPYHPAHTTAVAGLVNTKGGDDRFYNNIMVGKGKESPGPGKDAVRVAGFGLWVYDTRPYPLQTGGNVYCDGARPYAKEMKELNLAKYNPQVQVIDEGSNVYLQMTWDPTISDAETALVTTALLGKAKISELPYENPNGSPIKIDHDYFGQRRNTSRPTPGPFERPGKGQVRIKVW
jgi:alpha-N-arabinofuranosidase